MKIVIINYGAGNIQSIKFAIQRLGFEAVLSHNVEEILQADKVIFPGVGEASSAMKMLKSTGLDQIIPQLKQPVLGICLGMQLMCTHSEEGDTKGLGIFNVEVKRFSNQVKVPQIGWNQISNLKSELLEYTGHEQIVTFDYFGQQVLGKFSSTLDIKINKDLKLNIDVSQISLFDKNTKYRI